ncbi:MAG: hypothetical protein PHQ98_00820 [Candidatus ainarchaeum sp.]|nr:hypothetical protein [Candidatus ainarchaeum sp.]
MRFSEEQKRIAILLLNEPKTEDELNKQLNIPYDKLMSELKHMLKLDIISKEGYPTKYKLRQEIVQTLNERKKIAETDSYRIRLNSIIEFKAIEENLLKKNLDDICEALKKEKNFTIYDIKQAEIIEEADSEMYASFIEVNLSIKDFSSLILFLFYYGPTSIELIKPTKVEFSQYEFQDGLHALSEIFQKYAYFLTEKMTREELGKFYEKAYKKQK